MSRFTIAQLADLPEPVAVEVLSVEAILAETKLHLLSLDPTLSEALALESEPIVKLLEVFAFRELLLRQRINETVRAGMLAYAVGSDLDNLAAFYAVSRNIVSLGDPIARPPVPDIYETDEVFRARVLLTIDGFSVAGPVGAYRFHAFTSSGLVKDVRVYSPSPGVVSVTVMSGSGDGEPSSDLLDTVSAALNADDVRPLTDSVVVLGCVAVGFTIEAALTVYPGENPELVLDAAQLAVDDYLESIRLLGYNVPRSGIIRALHQSGVQSVNLVSPATDLVIDQDEVSFCTGVSLSWGGTDA